MLMHRSPALEESQERFHYAALLVRNDLDPDAAERRRDAFESDPTEEVCHARILALTSRKVKGLDSERELCERDVGPVTIQLPRLVE